MVLNRILCLSVDINNGRYRSGVASTRSRRPPKIDLGPVVYILRRLPRFIILIAELLPSKCPASVLVLEY